MRTKRLKLWITSGSVLLILVLAGHPPTLSFLYHTPNYLPALGFRILSLLLAVILLGSFQGIGVLISPILGLHKIPKYLQIPVQFFTGFILASVVVYLLGFMGLLYRVILVPIILLGACVAVYNIRSLSFKMLLHFKTSQLEHLEKWVLCCLGLFLIGRLFPVLNFNSFGDPLFYNLPVGRDYLHAGGFQWFEQAEFYWQAGMSDIGLVYLHSLTSHPMLVQLTSQAFYYLTGTLFLLHILHKGLFSKWIPKKHSLWLAFSFIAMDTFRLESIVAKSDYWLAVLLCLITVCLYEIMIEETQEIRLLFWKLILLFAGFCFSIKATSLFFLLPIGIAILLIGARLLPFKSPPFWGFFGVAMALGLLNSVKNQYIFGSPTIPFASDIFQSPYWDRVGLEGMRKLGKLEQGDFLDFPYVLFKLMLGHPVSLLLVTVSLVWRKYYINFRKFPTPQTHFLLILSFSWISGLILWLILLDPHVNHRYVIGLVFLMLLLIVIITFFILRPIFLQNNQRLQYAISGIALMLTISVSHTDVDFLQAKQWFSSKSLHHQWINNNNLAKVQNYLNNITTPETRVLFYYTTQRFHANFIVYGARSFSPRTRFVYSEDENEIKEGLKRIKPKYYVIRKDKIGNSGGLLAKKTYLDDNFMLIRNFNNYLLYKVPEEFVKQLSTNI